MRFGVVVGLVGDNDTHMLVLTTLLVLMHAADRAGGEIPTHEDVKEFELCSTRTDIINNLRALYLLFFVRYVPSPPGDTPG